ncbi:hypothetical protein L1887_63006 [Cichorium endivia]|nr:hypothetical protein L1887_63006 [Cichorium endivia]
MQVAVTCSVVSISLEAESNDATISSPILSRTYPWHCKPAESSHHVSRQRMNRRCSDRFVVVGIIQKDSPKVSDQINHEELASSLRSHGEIAASSVAAEGPLACQVCQDLPKLAWGPEDVVGRVRGKRKREDDNEEDQGINVVGDEGRFDSAVQCVNDHADWEEEDSGRSWGPGQEFDDTSTTCEKHGSDEDIREAAEDDEDAVRDSDHEKRKEKANGDGKAISDRLMCELVLKVDQGSVTYPTPTGRIASPVLMVNLIEIF